MEPNKDNSSCLDKLVCDVQPKVFAQFAAIDISLTTQRPGKGTVSWGIEL